MNKFKDKWKSFARCNETHAHRQKKGERNRNSSLEVNLLTSAEAFITSGRFPVLGTVLHQPFNCFPI